MDVNDRLAAMEPTDEDFARDPGRKTEERYKLVQAIRALLDGAPTDAQLRAILQDEGRVPITKFTVEREAGVDRRKFSGKASDNPDLSELLKDLKPDFGVSPTTTAKLKKQSQTIALLEQQLVAARSSVAAQVMRIEAMATKLRSAENRIKRLKAGEKDDDGS